MRGSNVIDIEYPTIKPTKDSHTIGLLKCSDRLYKSIYNYRPTNKRPHKKQRRKLRDLEKNCWFNVVPPKTVVRHFTRLEDKRNKHDEELPTIDPRIVDDLYKSIKPQAELISNGQAVYRQYQYSLVNHINIESSILINEEEGFPMSLKKFAISKSNGLITESSIPSNIDIDKHILHSITYKEEMMLTDEQQDTFSVCKLLLKQCSHHKQLCSKLSGAAILGSSDKSYVVYDPNGKFRMLMIRGVNNDSSTIAQWPNEHQYHIDNSDGHAKGCSASGLNNPNKVRWSVKQYKILKHSGVKGAASIDKVCPPAVGTANGCNWVYTNKDGKVISSQGFSGWIDFHGMSYHQTDLQIKRCSALERNYKLWRILCPAFFHNYELSSDISKDLQDALYIREYKRAGTNFIDNGTRPTLLVHTDPKSGYPTGVAGPSIYEVHHGKWRKRCGGGQLILLNGWHFANYTPQDLVLISPDTLHGVATMSDLSAKNIKLHRYSHTMTCNYKRGTKKCKLDLTSYKK